MVKMDFDKDIPFTPSGPDGLTMPSAVKKNKKIKK